MSEKKKVFYGFHGMDSIIKNVTRNLGLEKKMRHLTLVNLWPEIVGPKFKNNSRVVSVIKKYDFDVLLVAVSSSAVAHELFMFKRDILKKLSPISLSLELNIGDIFFNPKIWKDMGEKPKTQDNSVILNHLDKTPSDEELKEITVPENIVDSVRESIKSQNFSSFELKDRMLHTIIRDIKTQIWKKNNGFPICIKCGIPVNYFKSDSDPVCEVCKNIK